MRSWVNVKTFTNSLLICPVLSLWNYLARMTQLREADAGRIFVGTIKLHKSVSSQTLARWLKDLLVAAGIGTIVFG